MLMFHLETPLIMRTWLLLIGGLFFCGSAWSQRSNDTWKVAIDRYWGPGMPATEQVQIFDTFWTFADTAFAAFHNLDVDWNVVQAQYRSEIESGVSRGRFAAVMNHMALTLREPHTYVVDSLVNIQTAVKQGTPLLYGWVRGDNGHFGACLTPLPDRSLMVYNTVEDHPLGLEIGDRVLGYEGVSWSEAYPKLLAAELPIAHVPDSTTSYPVSWAASRWGSAPSAYDHLWLNAAGLNWHLFDTIDIAKHVTGDTLHLPVDPLAEASMHILCTEQLPVVGVGMPQPSRDQYITWGFVEESKVGYIYVWSWGHGDPQATFREAVDALVIEHEAEGLIIDFRFNDGGIAHFPNDGLAILFDTTVPTLGVAFRTSPDDHFAMQPTEGYVPYLDIPGDPTTYFDKPIAVLTGPGAFSGGDYTAVRLGFHPQARLFGKSTSSSFAPGVPVPFQVSGWGGFLSFLDAYRKDIPDQFLTHTERRVDEAVWLMPSDVVRGKDTVAQAALAWVRQVATVREQPQTPAAASLAQNYPNPFAEVSTVEVTLTVGGDLSLTIYTLLGQVVVEQVRGYYPAGTHTFQIDATSLAAGVYVYVLQQDEYIHSRKMLVVK